MEKKTFRDIYDKFYLEYSYLVDYSSILMDKYFAKGCKERGRALAFNGELIAYMLKVMNGAVELAADRLNQSVSQPEEKMPTPIMYGGLEKEVENNTEGELPEPVMRKTIKPSWGDTELVFEKSDKNLLESIFGEDKRGEEDKKLDQRIIESHEDNIEAVFDDGTSGVCKWCGGVNIIRAGEGMTHYYYCNDCEKGTDLIDKKDNTEELTDKRKGVDKGVDTKSQSGEREGTLKELYNFIGGNMIEAVESKDWTRFWKLMTKLIKTKDKELLSESKKECIEVEKKKAILELSEEITKEVETIQEEYGDDIEVVHSMIDDLIVEKLGGELKEIYDGGWGWYA